MKKEIPVSKIYEALSVLSDNRIKEKDKTCYFVTSSDHSKTYTVLVKDGIYSSNDNATYWQHYAGYPIIAVCLSTGVLSYDKSLLPHFKNVNWKKLNTQNKNNYDLSVNQFLSQLNEEEKKKTEEECFNILKALKKLDIKVKGNRNSLI